MSKRLAAAGYKIALRALHVRPDHINFRDVLLARPRIQPSHRNPVKFYPRPNRRVAFGALK